MSTEIKPRPFQLQIADHLMENNGIVYLPTGCGKTFIAILLLKRFSNDLSDTIQNGGKRSIFVCNTVELARQQAVEIEKHTNLKAGVYIGERHVYSRNRKQWRDDIDEHQVLVGTPQVFFNMIQQNLITMNDLNLVIFDECHHGTKTHPMHEFMRLYHKADQAFGLPRIIGLTGVLLKRNKVTNIIKELSNLESTYNARIITIRGKDAMTDVLSYSTNPKETLMVYPVQDNSIHEKCSNTVAQIQQIIASTIESTLVLPNELVDSRGHSKTRDLQNLLLDFLYQLKNFGLYCGSLASVTLLTELDLNLRQADTLSLRRLYRLAMVQLQRISHLITATLMDYNIKQKCSVLRKDGNKSKDQDEKENDVSSNSDTTDMIKHFSTPKMRALLESLTHRFSKKNYKDFKCLIFVERRFTAKVVLHVLQRYISIVPDLKDSVRAQFTVGRKSQVIQTAELKLNKNVIEKFREGEYNVLVCSNVLEEGIDIQTCNYVYVVDGIKTFSSYVQTKGRARSAESLYTVLVPFSKYELVVKDIGNYKRLQAEIQDYLSQRVLEEENLVDLDIDKQFKDLMPPLKSASGACLLASSALSLLHRYCQSLPWDKYGCAMPRFVELPSVSKGCLVSVRLPLQSTVKQDVVSNPMPSIKFAKISSALNVCRMLYENHELNEHLLPISRNECLMKTSDELFQHWQKFNDNVAQRPGKQRRRIYDCKCPELLYGAMPKVGEKCYAYEIKVTTNFERNDYNGHISDMLSTNSSYGILLSKQLPRLAEMQLFMQQGGLNVRIASEPIEVTLKDADELRKLQKYHLMVFRDILKCWKKFLVLDQRQKEYSYLIVPLETTDKASAINWSLINKFPKLDQQRYYTELERSNAVYKPEDWLGKIVKKWYAGDDRTHFVVTKIHSDMSPLSPFDKPGKPSSYESYLDFFESKYGSEIQRIVNKQQFLIEVKPLTERRNFLINSKGKNRNINKQTFRVILVPELCHIFNYPGDLWLQALFLPTILYRLNYILHAEKLRTWLHDLMIDKVNGVSSVIALYSPQPLRIDESLARATDIHDNAVPSFEEIPMSCLNVALDDDVTVEENKKTAFDFSDIKKCLEPTDRTRNSTGIFPVDGRLTESTNLADGMGFENCQLLMSHISSTGQKNTNNNNNNDDDDDNDDNDDNDDDDDDDNDNMLPLEDVTELERSHINILSINWTNNKKIPSAEQHELLAAITTAGASDVFDMERFELLGDSFLKLAASLYLADRYPNYNEGFLSDIKSRLVSNRNLLYCMLETEIPKTISATMLSPNGEWLPPLACLPPNVLEFCRDKIVNEQPLNSRAVYDLTFNEADILAGRFEEISFAEFKKTWQSEENACERDETGFHSDNDLNFLTYKQVLSDKVVADTLEAILGVAVLNYGIDRSFRLLQYFNIIQSPEPTNDLSDFKFCNPLLRADVSSRDIDGFLPNYKFLEEDLGYHFRDRAYLLQALTHPSYPTNRLTGCYQQLEFVGDSILDFLVSSYIFERHQNMRPGKLTDLRSALVNNITLACVCVRHRFHLHLLSENSRLSEVINNFAAFQKAKNYEISDGVCFLMEEKNISHTDDELGTSSDTEASVRNICRNIEVPKVLGDLVEALLAAVYFDSRDLNTTWQVIYKILKKEIHQFAYNSPVDPVRQLYEHKFAQATFTDPVISDDAVVVGCVFTSLNRKYKVTGTASNSHLAKKAAAKLALKILSKHK